MIVAAHYSDRTDSACIHRKVAERARFYQHRPRLSLDTQNGVSGWAHNTPPRFAARLLADGLVGSVDRAAIPMTTPNRKLYEDVEGRSRLTDVFEDVTSDLPPSSKRSTTPDGCTPTS